MANSTLSITEKKTRFDLLIDRIVQFISNVEPSHVQTEAEIRLIENIVLLSCACYPRGSNVVPWSLCPSRPMTLKMYTIRTLWKYSSARNGVLIGCDNKMVKTMVQSFFHTDREIILPNDLDILKKMCQVLGILPANKLLVTNNEDSLMATTATTNLSQTLEKLELMRETSLNDQKPAIERTVFKFEPIVQLCIDSAMKITRDFVELQNMERRILMNQMRAFDESKLAHEWKTIVQRMTHEGATWHCTKTYPRLIFYYFFFMYNYFMYMFLFLGHGN